MAEANFPGKKEWKQLVMSAIIKNEYDLLTENLICKGDVNRYLRIMESNNNKSLIYEIISKMDSNWEDLMILIRLLTLPKETQNVKCVVCFNDYDDIVYHIIMECPNFITQRNTIAENIIDILDVQSGVELFNMCKEDILDIYLGKKWCGVNEATQGILYKTIANCISKLFVKGIVQNKNWFIKYI